MDIWTYGHGSYDGGRYDGYMDPMMMGGMPMMMGSMDPMMMECQYMMGLWAWIL